MREILFRGKRKDNGEWIEGYYVRLFEKENGFYKAKHYIFDGNTKLSEERYCGHGNYEQDVKICKFEVIPETVGQFTGLTDRKSKKKIFEGDILEIAQKSDWLGTHYSPPIKCPVNVFVRWDLCGWIWETIGNDKFYLHFPDAWCHFECEVIGNLHDNPELLRSNEK